jgi:hypothetical protein
VRENDWNGMLQSNMNNTIRWSKKVLIAIDYLNDDLQLFLLIQT